MIDDKIRDVLARRKAIHPEDDYNTEKCWNEEIDVLCQNIDETIDFLLNRCTADEFSWISEVFDEVTEKSQSHNFIKCLYDVAKKYPEDAKKYNLIYFIDTAKEFLE